MGNPPTLQNFQAVFMSLVGRLLVFGAFALFIMLIVGAFKYLTSGGDPKATEGAKKTLTYAIGGFVLFLASYMILRIIGTITGTEDIITNFSVFRK